METRTFHVASLASWDLILGLPSLNKNKAQIDTETHAVTIKPPGMNRFTLTPWTGGADQAGIQIAATNLQREKLDQELGASS